MERAAQRGIASYVVGAGSGVVSGLLCVGLLSGCPDTKEIDKLDYECSGEGVTCPKTIKAGDVIDVFGNDLGGTKCPVDFVAANMTVKVTPSLGDNTSVEVKVPTGLAAGTVGVRVWSSSANCYRKCFTTLTP